MTREELERRIDEAEKQSIGLLGEIKWLKEKLADMQDEPEIPEIPDIPKFESPVVWAMDSKLGVFYYGISPYNESSFNAFNTKEMAQEFAKKCKLIAMMLHCKWYVDREYVPDWDNEDEEKWMVFWSNTYKKYEVCGWESDEYGSVFFSTEEAAQKCADWMNEHWKEETE